MDARRWSRREFLTYTGAVAVTASMGPFVHVRHARGAQELVFVSWGGAYQDAQREAHIKPFMKATGVRVVEIKEGPRIAKLKAMVESGNVEWDVIDFETSDMLRAAAAGLLEPIDKKMVDTGDILATARHEYAVGNISWSTVMAYNTKKYPPGKPRPVGWQDFWDVKKWPGPRGLQDLVKTNLEYALLADGVPKDKLYPLDVDRAFKSLDRIRSHVTVWWAKGAQPPQLLADGAVDLCSAYNGRIFAAKKEGAPVDLDWTGGTLDYDWWCVPKGTRKKELAMKFVAFAIQPEGQADLTKHISYGPTNQKAWAHVDRATAPHLPTAPENFPKQVVLNNQWWLEHEAKLIERWEAWKLKK